MLRRTLLSLIAFLAISGTASAVDLVNHLGVPWGNFEVRHGTLMLSRYSTNTVSFWQRDPRFDNVDRFGQQRWAYAWYEQGLIMNVPTNLSGQITRGRIALNNLHPVGTNIYLTSPVPGVFGPDRFYRRPLPWHHHRPQPWHRPWSRPAYVVPDTMVLQQQVEPAKQIEDAVLTLVNTHSKVLLVDITDSLARQRFETIQLAPGGRQDVSIHRYDNPKLHETTQRLDLIGQPFIQQSSVELQQTPHLEVRVSEYKVVSTYIDRTGKDPVGKTERKASRGLGVFYLPTDLRLQSGTLDALQAAQRADNPGAFRFNEQIDLQRGITPVIQP